MSLKLGTVNIAGLNTNAHSLFDFKWSDHLQNDMSWLRADTFSWQDGTVYSNAYNKLVSEYNNGTTETVGGITYKRTTNGFKIADASQENAILNKYNSDGIAWFYILDTTNTRFKLPRTKFGFEGLRTSVGDDIAESLPNITGFIDTPFLLFGSGSGAIRGQSGNWHHFAEAESGGSYSNFTFNASRSSSTYQDNAPVQERATQMYLYFYVGEYAQTAIEQTAGLNSEVINSKLDIPTGKTQADVKLVIETYVNGTSGYRIWSDGYCEQWGFSAGNPTVSLLKTYKDTNYNIVTNKYTTSTNAYAYTNVNSIAVGSFYIVGAYNGGSGTTYSFFWNTKGYLASGQY